MTSHPDNLGGFCCFVSDDKGAGRFIRIMLTSGQSGKVHRKSGMERIIFETAIQYEPSHESKHSDLCCDLSEGGLYIRTKYPFETDETLTLSFSVPQQEQEVSISCNARVAWTNFDTNRRKTVYPSGVGVQFLDLSREDLNLLSNFIDEYDQNKKMNVVCAWCGNSLGLRNGPLGTTSHGICSQCREKLD